MSASNRWNLSSDYYDALPADSEMDSDGSDRCNHCDGYLETEYYIPMNDSCRCEEEDE